MFDLWRRGVLLCGFESIFVASLTFTDELNLVYVLLMGVKLLFTGKSLVY